MASLTLTNPEPTVMDGARTPVTINPELRSLIPPLTTEEYGQLEANLVAEGCRDPLVVWQETRALLDGHNRYDICTSHGIPYTTVEVSLPSLDAAKVWMLANQLGRRNLTPEQTSYFRGEQYNLLKRQGKRTDLTSPHTDGKSPNTAHALAARFQVGVATIERDGAYARAVDTLAEALGPEVRQTILARESHLTQGQVKQLAAIATHTNPQTAGHILVQAQQAPTPKAARQILQAAVRRNTHLAELEEAEALAEQGVTPAAHCTVCRRPLSDPDSISHGIGPCCAGKTPAASGSPSAGPLFTDTSEPPTLEALPTDTPAYHITDVYTGEQEWYTPPAFVEKVREVLGTIDLDPASCARAQETVQATTYYTREEDGLRQPWHGNVFVNPPYGYPILSRFVGKLIDELTVGHVAAAILLTNASTAPDWFQRAARLARALCLTDGRLSFVSPDPARQTTTPPLGQCVFYFGDDVARFCEHFQDVGVILRLLSAPAADAALFPLELPAPAPARSGRSGTYGQIPAKVLAALQAHGTMGATAHTLATAVAVPYGQVWTTLERLVKQNKAAKAGTLYLATKGEV